jgi:hypothetical protein
VVWNYRASLTFNLEESEKMAEAYVEQVHHDIVLDIGNDVGSLIVYTRENLRGLQIDVSLKGDPTAKRVHTDVLERRIAGRPVFAAVFASLPEGDYITWSDPTYELTIVGGHIAELDWRTVDVYVPPVSSSNFEGRSGPVSQTSSSALSSILPPRYRNGNAVSSAPMGTAPMRYTEDGLVSWDEMWTDFCDLALAGGPPHRDTLLEPVPPDEVKADLENYEHVLVEIERGWRLVTGLSTVRSEKLGWVGLQCDDEEMALWMLRAIVVENVCVRREGKVLYLPAGPTFSLDKEIKNVITVVAKTHHYWTEHINS